MVTRCETRRFDRDGSTSSRIHNNTSIKAARLLNVFANVFVRVAQGSRRCYPPNYVPESFTRGGERKRERLCARMNSLAFRSRARGKNGFSIYDDHLDFLVRLCVGREGPRHSEKGNTRSLCDSVSFYTKIPA